MSYYSNIKHTFIQTDLFLCGKYLGWIFLFVFLFRHKNVNIRTFLKYFCWFRIETIELVRVDFPDLMVTSIFPFFSSFISLSPLLPGMLSCFALWLHVTRWQWCLVTWLIAMINTMLNYSITCCHGSPTATLFCMLAYVIFLPKVPMVHGATPATVSAATTSATSVPFAATATANQVC